jgi:hypothetical protein
VASEEKNTDITDASSCVDFSSVRKIKPPRLLCAFSVGILYLALAAICWAGARFGTVWSDIEVQTPVATGLLLHLTHFLQTKVGMITAGLSFLLVFLLVIRGTLDTILKGLIIVNVIIVAGLIIWAFASLLFPLYDLIPSLRASPRPK